MQEFVGTLQFQGKHRQHLAVTAILRSADVQHFKILKILALYFRATKTVSGTKGHILFTLIFFLSCVDLKMLKLNSQENGVHFKVVC
jgi:hypothetical protein